MIARQAPMSGRAVAAGLVLLFGCVLPAPLGCAGADRNGAERGAADTGPQAPISNTDPCAMRLHDLSGAMLLYYGQNLVLPEDLAELSSVAELVPVPPAVCPVSNRPYVYDPAGIQLPERQAWVVLYDAAPSHSRMRWAVTLEEPADGGAPVAKVIALPESFFVLRPPR